MCVLSKRWRNLWASVQSLNFKFFAKFRDDANSFKNFLSSFLDHGDGDSSVHTFKLRYFSLINVTVSLLFEKWIVYALEHKVKNLAVDIWGDRIWFASNFPFTCNALEDMHLDGFDEIEADSVFLPRLKNLSLYNFSMHGYSMQKLLFGCPTLVTLSIKNVIMWMNDISFRTLKRLSVENWHFDSCPDTPTVSIYAPRLEYLMIVESCGCWVALKDMPRVTKAMEVVILIFSVVFQVLNLLS